MLTKNIKSHDAFFLKGMNGSVVAQCSRYDGRLMYSNPSPLTSVGEFFLDVIKHSFKFGETLTEFHYPVKMVGKREYILKKKQLRREFSKAVGNFVRHKLLIEHYSIPADFFEDFKFIVYIDNPKKSDFDIVSSLPNIRKRQVISTGYRNCIIFSTDDQVTIDYIKLTISGDVGLIIAEDFKNRRDQLIKQYYKDHYKALVRDFYES